MTIKTRFAPSPTGMLHIGGVRTAIFNWLYAKRHHGNFYLRIEDTDKKRSDEKYLDSINSGLNWLGLNWDKKIIYQSANIERHMTIVKSLISQGKAYYCYTTHEEIQDFKQRNPGKKFISQWREKSISKRTIPGVVRLKTALSGSTVLIDRILGKVVVNNSAIDDIVLLRSDSTPTYHIACVIDDHDMEITHVIRGNDHFTNTFRQLQILKALKWNPAIYAHIPLIHNSDGNKMSKRDGAISINEYKNLGYLPEAIFNYLLRLGWSYGDEEIINIQKAVDSFDLKNMNKSPSKFDLDKLQFINHHYINTINNETIFQKVIDKIDKQLLSREHVARIKKSIPLIKSRGHTLNELVDLASIFIAYSNPPDDQSKALLELEQSIQILKKIFHILDNTKPWKADVIKQQCFDFAKQFGIQFPEIMKILRSGILGTFKSPPIYKTLEIMTQNEVLKRISKLVKFNYHLK